MGIGNTCVVMDYEKALGITSGYSRGRYCLHVHGFWPDDEVLIEMHQRWSAKQKNKKQKKAPELVD